MKRYLLLDAADIHRAGDEMFCLMELRWIPVPALHYGDTVGADSAPCRRELRTLEPETKDAPFRPLPERATGNDIRRGASGRNTLQI
jgi:hypothetical protein